MLRLLSSADGAASMLGAGAHLIGVLYVESPESSRFGWEDEDVNWVTPHQLRDAATNLREAVRAGRPDEMKRMQDLIRTNLENGAYAVSSGLDYKPGQSGAPIFSRPTQAQPSLSQWPGFR